MRLKLVLISSLTAAIVGAGSVIAIILFVFSSLKPIATPGLLVFSTFLLPILTTALASIFVYRHTARRRKLQAALTVLSSLVLILALFLLASIIMSRRENIQAGAGLIPGMPVGRLSELQSVRRNRKESQRISSLNFA
jgi:hypothetical protein